MRATQPDSSQSPLPDGNDQSKRSVKSAFWKLEGLALCATVSLSVVVPFAVHFLLYSYESAPC